MPRAALFIVLLGVVGAANADAPFGRGAYVGGSVGLTIFDDDSAFDFEYEDEDNALQAFGGYKFFRHFAVEARLSDLGSYSNVFDETLDVSATSVSAVGLIPFGESGWELVGHLGFARINQQVSGGYDETDTGLVGGIGVRWHLSKNVALGAQIDAFSWENDELVDFGDSNDTIFSVGTQQLVIQINF